MRQSARERDAHRPSPRRDPGNDRHPPGRPLRLGRARLHHPHPLLSARIPASNRASPSSAARRGRAPRSKRSTSAISLIGRAWKHAAALSWAPWQLGRRRWRRDSVGVRRRVRCSARVRSPVVRDRVRDEELRSQAGDAASRSWDLERSRLTCRIDNPVKGFSTVFVTRYPGGTSSSAPMLRTGAGSSVGIVPMAPGPLTRLGNRSR